MRYKQRGFICQLFVSLYMKNEFEMYLEIHGTAFCFPGDMAFKALATLCFPANVVLGSGQKNDSEEGRFLMVQLTCT